MAGNKKIEQVATTPPATLEEALLAIETKESLLNQKETEISNLKTEKESLSNELEKAKSEFASYKKEAESALESLSNDQVIVTDKPVLKHKGVLYSFKITRFAIRGKGMVNAQQVIDNPDAFENEIEDLINKFKILKPFNR